MTVNGTDILMLLTLEYGSPDNDIVVIEHCLSNMNLYGLKGSPQQGNNSSLSMPIAAPSLKMQPPQLRSRQKITIKMAL
jgi:hypothetical protein